MIFQSDDGKSFNQEQAIDLLVSLVATDANSEKKWRGFYNSLSITELQDEGMTTGKLERIARHKKTCSKAGSLGDLEQVFPCFHCSEDLISSRWVFLRIIHYLASTLKRRSHRVAPMPTNLCEECRSSVLLL